MRKFSFRSSLIFAICLIVAVLLIGLGVAGVIKFKHRNTSNNSANEPQQPLQMSVASGSGVMSLKWATSGAPTGDALRSSMPDTIAVLATPPLFT
jgi:hypothetical protein